MTDQHDSQAGRMQASNQPRLVVLADVVCGVVLAYCVLLGERLGSQELITRAVFFSTLPVLWLIWPSVVAAWSGSVLSVLRVACVQSVAFAATYIATSYLLPSPECRPR